LKARALMYFETPVAQARNVLKEKTTVDLISSATTAAAELASSPTRLEALGGNRMTKRDVAQSVPAQCADLCDDAHNHQRCESEDESRDEGEHLQRRYRLNVWLDTMAPRYTAEAIPRLPFVMSFNCLVGPTKNKVLVK